MIQLLNISQFTTGGADWLIDILNRGQIFRQMCDEDHGLTYSMQEKYSYLK